MVTTDSLEPKNDSDKQYHYNQPPVMSLEYIPPPTLLLSGKFLQAVKVILSLSFSLNTTPLGFHKPMLQSPLNI